MDSGQAFSPVSFWTLAGTFGLVLIAQVGFLVHQLAFLEPALGHLQAALAVSATTVSALVGRVAAGMAGRPHGPRVLSAIMFAMQSAALAAMALSPARPCSSPPASPSASASAT